MEAVAAVSSIAGIASFGLQLAHQLQQQIGEIVDAEERVNDLVSELQATSNNLEKIKSLLLSDDTTSSHKQTVNEQFRKDLQFLIGRCEIIFRKVVKLLAKAGSMALSSVDKFLRPFKKNKVLHPDPDLKLEIEFVKLSASDKALWSFKKPKIEQYIADLGRLKSELMMLLMIVSLVKIGQNGSGKDNVSVILESDDATLYVDDIYYTDQALGKANKTSDNPATSGVHHSKHDKDDNSSDDDDSSEDDENSEDDIDGSSNSYDSNSDMTSSVDLSAESVMLFLSWPSSSTNEPPTLEQLLEHRIFFEAYAINISEATPEYTKLQIPYRQLYERALQFARSSEKNIIDLISDLPFSHQKILEKILLKIDPKFRNQSSGKQLGRPVVVSLESHYHSQPITRLGKLKVLLGYRGSRTRAQCITITLLRLEVPKEDDEDDEDEDEIVEEEKQQDAIKLVEQEKEQAEKKAAEEAAKRAAEEAAKKKGKPDLTATAAERASTQPVVPKSPIRFKDAVGRKFTFPFELCCTWPQIEQLIRQAFLHVDTIGPHVEDGHYDLIGPSGEIILPMLWESVIQPGMSITQHMWPIPEPPRPANIPIPRTTSHRGPPPPPPPGWSGPPPGKAGPPPPPPGSMPPPIPFNPPKPPARQSTSSILFAGKPKQKKKAEKRPTLMIPIKRVEKEVLEDVERIADYKAPKTKDADAGDEVEEGVMPSDEMKKEVARHYLLKWTTEWQAGRGLDKSPNQESEEANTPVDPDIPIRQKTRRS